MSDTNIVLSIIIVNYNGKHFFKDCLKSISEHVPFEHEVIVVDNASVDGSAEYLHSTYPDIILIESKINLGFTGGNNLGARYANGRYLLLLNNDTVIRTSVYPLVHLMDLDKNIGALGCRLVYADLRQQESIGYMPGPFSLVLSWTPFARLLPQCPSFRRTVYSDSPLYNQSCIDVEWVSGAFLLTKLESWKSLNGLDEQYFMYMEDTDYCRRIAEANQKIIYSADCTVTHFEGAGRPWIGERALINTTNSYLIYIHKFYGPYFVFAFRSLLFPVFAFRSASFFLLYLLDRSQTNIEKSCAFYKASRKLLFDATKVRKKTKDTADA